MRQLPLYITSAYILGFVALSHASSVGMELWPWLTFLSHALLLAVVTAYYTHGQTRSILRNNATLIAFVVTLTATTGSLFYAEIAGLTPCKLCWFQRIFMYPLPILLGMAHWRGESIVSYIRGLAGIGAFFSVLHYVSQFFTIWTSCSAHGPSCSTKMVFHLGYITIPLMALTAFVIVLVLPYETS